MRMSMICYASLMLLRDVDLMMPKVTNGYYNRSCTVAGQPSGKALHFIRVTYSLTMQLLLIVTRIFKNFETTQHFCHLQTH